MLSSSCGRCMDFAILSFFVKLATAYSITASTDSLNSPRRALFRLSCRFQGQQSHCTFGRYSDNNKNKAVVLSHNSLFAEVIYIFDWLEISSAESGSAIGGVFDYLGEQNLKCYMEHNASVAL